MEVQIEAIGGHMDTMLRVALVLYLAWRLMDVVPTLGS